MTAPPSPQQHPHPPPKEQCSIADSILSKEVINRQPTNTAVAALDAADAPQHRVAAARAWVTRVQTRRADTERRLEPVNRRLQFHDAQAEAAQKHLDEIAQFDADAEYEYRCSGHSEYDCEMGKEEAYEALELALAEDFEAPLTQAQTEARQYIDAEDEVEEQVKADAEVALQDRLAEAAIAWCEANRHTSGFAEALARHDGIEGQQYCDEVAVLDRQAQCEAEEHSREVRAERWCAEVDDHAQEHADEIEAQIKAEVAAQPVSRPLCPLYRLVLARRQEHRDLLTRTALQKALRAINSELQEAVAALDAAVNAPVPNGVDPTAWLPDELLLMVLQRVQRPVGCPMVCRRWMALCRDPRVRIHLRWDGFESGNKSMKYYVHEVYAYAYRRQYLVTALTVSDSGRLYSASAGGSIYAWSPGKRNPVLTMLGHAEAVTALAVGGDGTLYSGSRDKTVNVWSRTNGSYIGTLCGHTDAVLAVWVGEYGSIFSGSADHSIIAWSTKTFKQQEVLSGHTDAVSAIAGDGDGTLYTGSVDTTIRVWSASMEHSWTCAGHTAAVTAVVLGDSKDTLFSSAKDGTVRAWSTVDGSLLRTWQSHAGPVLSLAVHENLIYSAANEVGANEMTLCIHRLGVRQKEHVVRGLSGVPISMTFGPNGVLYMVVMNSLFVYRL